MGVEIDEVKNYCHEACQFSMLPVGEGGEKLFRNGKLQCALGYTQSVNSVQALANSIMNEAYICRILRKKFRAKQAKMEASDVKETRI